MSNPPVFPILPFVLTLAASAAVFWFGGPMAGVIALFVVAPLATAHGFLSLRRALYVDGYLADFLPDGRGKHGKPRWRVGVVEPQARATPPRGRLTRARDHCPTYPQRRQHTRPQRRNTSAS